MLDHKDIQVVCIKELTCTGMSTKFKEGKLYHGREHNDGFLIIYCDEFSHISFPNGSKSEGFQEHFKFFTG